MAGTYQVLFRVPGSRAFFMAGFVGRMSMAMIGIGIVLLVSAATGSYGVAGGVTAAFALASAAATPLAGRLSDSRGQHQVLFAVSGGTAVSTTALITCAELGAPTWTLFCTAAALGASSPSLGGLVRARWSHLLDAPARLQTAYSLESVADELVFVTGPIVVTAASTGVHPAAGLAVAGALTVSGCLALAAQRHTEPAPRRDQDSGTGSAITNPGMLVLVTVCLLLGLVFTAVEITAVAFADDEGHRGAAGPLLSIFALGSMVAGLWYGARRWRAPLSRRFCLGLVLLAVGLIPIVVVRGLPLMMVVIFFAGLAISPTLIPAFGLVERLVHRHRLTEGFSWLTTAVRIGITIGAPAAGWIIDTYGTRTAFAVPVLVATLAATIALTASRTLRTPESAAP